MTAQHHVKFHRVLRDELEEVKKRRQGPVGGGAPADTLPGSPAEPGCSPDDLIEERRQQTAALNSDLAGLALSGGGIRSATFALGVVQALASFGLLKRFDYLSTVSGGGYLGSWLAAWIKREGDVGSVEQQLQPSRVEQHKGCRPGPDRPPRPMDEEPEPIYHLRAYSRYLAPRRGLLSADSWVLVAIYLRNILLNNLVLLPVCVAALLATRFLEHAHFWGGDPFADCLWLSVMFAALGVALVAMVLNFFIARTPLRRQATAQIRLQVGVRLFHFLIVIPLFLFAAVASWYLSRDVVTTPQQAAGVVGTAAVPNGPFPVAAATWDTWEAPWTRIERLLPWDQGRLRAWERTYDPTTSHWLLSSLLLGAFFGSLVALVYAPFRLLYLGFRFWRSARASRGEANSGGWFWELPASAWAVICTFLAGFTGGALLHIGFGVVLREAYDQPCAAALVTTLGPPLVVLCIVAGVIVLVGLLGTQVEEDEREWWASLCGWLMIDTAAWLVVVGLSLFGPVVLALAPVWGQALLGGGWLATAAAGVRAGRSPHTSTGRGHRPLELLALVAPPVFLVGLLVLLGLLLDLALGVSLPAPGQTAAYYLGRLELSAPGLAVATGACLVFACFVAWRVDVNTFSLHGLYADRLVRCYLGASRPKERGKTDRHLGAPANSQGPNRQPDPVTGFDPADDFALHRLRLGPDADAPEQPYWGPYPLINTALNLVQGDELAWQDRLAESFVLSPRYCGSRSTGYSVLSPSDRDALRLGTAVTLSGAAVSPNMGYHSSPAVTALLTLFNVRLGGWVGNPRDRTPGNSGPVFGPLYLFKELFGRTNARARYVYLSDGGHFDNLGVYELIRRRCRYIVACDAEQDADYTFEALSALARKCLTDFGVRIEIDVSPLRPQGEAGRCRWHCAVGRIRYDEVDEQAIPGVLVYLKASLTGDEPAEVLNYAEQHPSFPHQTTADQFFTEAQFESYRALGQHVGHEVFCEAMQGLADREGRGDVAHRRVVNQLFANLHSRWFPPPPDLNVNFLQSVRAYVEVEEALRSEPNLRDFSRSLYPELGLDPEADGAEAEGDRRAERRRAELHLVGQMLQVMEDAWLGLPLEGSFAHPLNRGWMNTFRRWTTCRNFRRQWPVLRGEFSKDFVRFCERELGLSAVGVRAERLEPDASLLGDPAGQPPDNATAWRRRALGALRDEFSWEWPREPSLDDQIRSAWQWGQGAASVWLLRLVSQDVGTEDTLPVCGIILTGPSAAGAQELDLLVWLRGPYRDLGLGRQGVAAVFREMADAPRYQGLALRTRYPQEGFVCRDEQLRSAMWRTFFIRYGFRPPPSVVGSRTNDLVLCTTPESWRQAVVEETGHGPRARRG